MLYVQTLLQLISHHEQGQVMGCKDKKLIQLISQPEVKYAPQ